jgi:nicotinamide-nucleotide amidase
VNAEDDMSAAPRRAEASEATFHSAARLGALLEAHGWRVSTAESCTGGLVAGAITDIAGSSAWFDRGFVTYSNAAKTEMLGVRVETLATYGAVSEPTAREMVAGALERSASDIAVAVTGIAGPSGGTPAKPVGLVCFAWARRGGAVRSLTERFPGDRAAVREASVVAALDGLIALAAAG